MKKRVLVFPCGSEIGLEIYKSVKHSIHFELFGLSSVADHGKFVYENYIEGISFIDDNNFIVELKEIIYKYKIDIIYPTMDSVISKLKHDETELGIVVIGPSSTVSKICSSKTETYNLLKDYIRVPKLYDKCVKSEDLPLFSKPDVGYGSRNVAKVDDKSQLVNFDFHNFILCEYLPGPEFTVDCFTGTNGDLLYVGARERIRTSNGISVNTKSSLKLTEKLRGIAEKINEIIPFKGSWFFQVKEDINSVPCLLEIACRFAGSSSVHRVQGVNFALMNLYIACNVEPEIFANHFEVELDRSLNNCYCINIQYDTVFIDYDDTIILDNKVNLEAITFIFYCLNKQIRLFLITKHKGDLQSNLKKHKLSELLENIVHLKAEEEKTDFILKIGSERAIFIDDSFLERKKVFDNCKIPVFGVDSIGSLINKH
jgi:predicted ATP-grasp superfamily ATP-dependent carboligase